MAKAYDPCMHTAEHVLNQTMIRLFGCGRSYSSHLNADKSKCDYHFSHPLSDQDARELETQINVILAEDLPVRTEFVSRGEAQKLVSLTKLPDTVATDPDQLVRVGDYDLCPCIGEHVAHTGEVGVFQLISHDFTPSGEEQNLGRLRIRFRVKRPE